jgi:hypothetical protein
VVAFGALDAQAAERVVSEVVRIRGLPVAEPIRFAQIPAQALREEVEADLARMKNDGSLETYRKAWIRLELLAPEVDLARAYADLYSGEPLGYYDDQSRRMRIVVKERVRTEVTEIVGLARRRDPVYGEVLAHETTHALQDQRWHLTQFQRASQEDARLARRALVEGDASKVGFAYGALFFQSFRSFSEYVAGRIDALNAGDRTPAWLREQFQFPYVYGGMFVERLHERGGFAAVDAAYADPPASTEQILHPAKYLATPRDVPLPVAGDLLPPAGWKRLYGTTLGELGLRVLVGRVAAQDWGGDHAEVWEGERGELALAWATVWDDEAAAARFEAAYRAHAGAVTEPFLLSRQGLRVAVVRGIGGEAAAAALARALAEP